jgi:GNAT superfamily N-acetyltransferase
MHQPNTHLVVRRFDAARDAGSLTACIVDQQNVHRRIESSWPDGASIAEDYAAYLNATCAAHNGCILIAECDGEAAGFVCVVAALRGEAPDDPAPFAWVQDLYVKPEYRRQGVAGMLMADAERFARAEGAHQIRLGVLNGNDGARAFYARYGFREYTRVLTKSLA